MTEIYKREQMTKTKFEKELNKKANLELLEIFKNQIDKMKPNEFLKADLAIKGKAHKPKWSYSRSNSPQRTTLNGKGFSKALQDLSHINNPSLAELIERSNEESWKD